ncbi:Ribosomal assembly complex component Ipi3 [Penicillium manginii]|uniref:Ribosomal assembly complex component Ipi3 n=1 Tax=Penicillium manginii TaxID=203109 RepID=UPI002547B189|nr:Ribosomal assembly complex component Ipi3 [Penicillium manginii]KAJ5768263.1 Ribosomal assembly complex component Ipi3 [Penicillium manginii]
MLSESFVASTLLSAKSSAATLRDVGICLQEFQPSPQIRSTFKKSSTHPNGLAVSPTHIFAAQADKAVIHVYSREKGNQEALVPFPERIRSIAVAGAKYGDVLILGTEGGRLIVWETCTGRQVSTTASHLQPVTSIVVDPTSNFILSGSPDAAVHVWSLPGILSFSKPTSSQTRQPSNAPIRTFSNHRAAITALAIGHSNGRHNIAVSTAKDNTAIAWDYHTGRVLRTFLLPSSATCVALDPVDRAGYVGYEDGSVQSIDFYRGNTAQHTIHDASLQSTPAQVTSEDRWLPPSADSGSTLLSWNIARRKFATTVGDYTHPVTNLVALPPTGLQPASKELKRTAHTIVKPRHDNASSDPSYAPGAVPADYVFNTHITAPSQPRNLKSTLFSQALTHASFPDSMIDDGLAELAALRTSGGSDVTRVVPVTSTISEPTEDASSRDNHVTELETEVAMLKKKAAVNDTARHATADEVVQLRSDLATLQDYINELHEKQEAAQRDKVARQARKEEREIKKREAWLAAEKKGRNGDAAMKKMDVDGDLTSDSDDLSDE